MKKRVINLCNVLGKIGVWFGASVSWAVGNGESIISIDYLVFILTHMYCISNSM